MFRLTLILFTFIFVGCTSTPKKPDCIGERTKNAEIIWGEITDGGKQRNYYTLKSDLKITQDAVPKITEEALLVAQIDSDTFCSIYNDLMNLMLKVQTLYVPADSNHFVEFINPDMNYRFRAVWNPINENKGNRDFRQFRQRLNNLITTHPINK